MTDAIGGLIAFVLVALFIFGPAIIYVLVYDWFEERRK